MNTTLPTALPIPDRLPLAIADNAPPEIDPDEDRVPPRARRGESAAPEILLIDDDDSVRAALARVLEQEGLPVLPAAGGEEALELLAAFDPGLVITDLRMGVVDGWDLLFHLRLQHPRLPIFVITALPPKATGGANDFATAFFQKPLDIDALIAAVRKHLGPAPGAG